MMIGALLAGFSIFGAVAQTAAASDEQTVEVQAQNEQNAVVADNAAAQEVSKAESASEGALKYVAAAIAVGVACIAGGIAVGKIGAAAMGAMSENAELSGKALPFVGLAEGICLWGFLVALLIIIL
ncbi:MAG: ATP synthase subunit C [Treponema sp.]|nr:ATP synthase subunit C [Treponema sp.]